jgi:hypothetical protein
MFINPSNRASRTYLRHYHARDAAYVLARFLYTLHTLSPNTAASALRAAQGTAATAIL